MACPGSFAVASIGRTFNIGLSVSLQTSVMTTSTSAIQVLNTKGMRIECHYIEPLFFQSVIEIASVIITFESQMSRAEIDPFPHDIRTLEWLHWLSKVHTHNGFGEWCSIQAGVPSTCPNKRLLQFPAPRGRLHWGETSRWIQRVPQAFQQSKDYIAHTHDSAQ